MFIKLHFMVIFMLLVLQSQSLSFTISILSNQEKCFSEFITESTPFHYKVESSINTFTISFVYKDGTVLITNSNNRAELIKKIDSYASISAEYGFCIKNQGDETALFTLSLFQGLQLSDLSFLPKQEDSKIIEQMIDKINEVYQVVKEQESYSKTVNEYNMELQKLVSFKSVGFGFLSITVVLIVSFLHYLEIKRVLKNRKII